MLFVTLFLKQAQVPGHIVEKLKKFDWLGSVLFSAGSASFLFGLTAGGVRYPWYDQGLAYWSGASRANENQGFIPGSVATNYWPAWNGQLRLLGVQLCLGAHC